jgi:hypothetical protein
VQQQQMVPQVQQQQQIRHMQQQPTVPQLLHLTPDERQIIAEHRVKRIIANHRANRPKHIPIVPEDVNWDEHPRYTYQQLQTFTQEQWNNKIYGPFRIMCNNSNLGVALRFLAYIPMTPDDIITPTFVRDTCQYLGIGRTNIEIATFLLRDFDALRAPIEVLRNSQTVFPVVLDNYVWTRTHFLQQLMEDCQRNLGH